MEYQIQYQCTNSSAKPKTKRILMLVLKQRFKLAVRNFDSKKSTQ